MELCNSTTRKQEFHNYTYTIYGIINDFQFGLFEIINFVCSSTVISMFGIVANIINITIFFQQGFTTTVNISFFGIAISDLCSLITLLWVIVWLNPFMSNSDVPVAALEFQYLTGACPHAVCGRITSYITVYVTAERCLCVLLPLKVKQIVTPARTAIVVCLIFIFNFLTIVPEYATSYLDWQFSPGQNMTVLSIAYRSGRAHVVAIVFFLYCLMGILSFVALLVFTVTLAIKLQQSSEWRKEATSGAAGNKEKKTVKMIVAIATILIVCYIPGTAVSLTTFVEPEFYLQGCYFRLHLSMWSIAFVFNAVSSSVNIFLYYRLSSNYRKTFKTVFRGNCFQCLLFELGKKYDMTYAIHLEL